VTDLTPEQQDVIDRLAGRFDSVRVEPPEYEDAAVTCVVLDHARYQDRTPSPGKNAMGTVVIDASGDERWI
jgi:hypothetical protein